MPRRNEPVAIGSVVVATDEMLEDAPTPPVAARRAPGSSGPAAAGTHGSAAVDPDGAGFCPGSRSTSDSCHSGLSPAVFTLKP